MKKIVSLSAILISVFLVLLTLSACDNPNKSGGTIDEPEITVEYLANEYSKQLLRDGAVYILGTIEIISDENGNPFLIISEKEFVSDLSYPNGFYIADKNLTYKYPLSFEARTSHLSGGTSIPIIMSSENFVKAVATDVKLYSESNPEFSSSRLYEIYVLGEQVEMILAKYIP